MSKLSEFDEAARVGHLLYLLYAFFFSFMFAPLAIGGLLFWVKGNYLYWFISIGCVITFPLGIAGIKLVTKWSKDNDDPDPFYQLQQPKQKEYQEKKYIQEKPFTDSERDYEISCHRNLLIKGMITEEEFIKRIKDVNAKSERPYPIPEEKTEISISSAQASEQQSSHDEREILALLKEYKSLLDSGVLTQSEFDKKKKELLNKSSNS